jgi:hypothetical protein
MYVCSTGPVYEKQEQETGKEPTAKRARSPHGMRKDLARASSFTPRDALPAGERVG